MSNTLRLGDIAPDFKADTTRGPISFHEWIGDSWAILFSHPADYTPVCTTELAEVARRQADFAKRNVKLIGLSVDDIQSHQGWIQDINEVGNVKFDIPIIADDARKVSTLYGMLDQKANDPTNVTPSGLPLTVRSVFIIDPKKKIRLIITYPASCGRSFDEILRVVDSLQLTDRQPVATPVNWTPGDDVIIHVAVSDEDAQKKFPGYKTHKPYLRTAQLKE